MSLLVSMVILVVAGGIQYLSSISPEWFDEETTQHLQAVLGVQDQPTLSPAPSAVPVLIPPPSSATNNSLAVKVVSVVDGDTIKIESGETVRYIGIDTPETKHPTKKVECFGQEAAQRNQELVLDKYVILEKDVSNTDRYGRLLRYVWIDDVFINKQLVEEGYALASSYPPDVAKQDEFRAAEREAREQLRGLWSACPTVVDDSPNN